MVGVDKTRIFELLRKDIQSASKIVGRQYPAGSKSLLGLEPSPLHVCGNLEATVALQLASPPILIRAQASSLRGRILAPKCLKIIPVIRHKHRNPCERN